MKTTCLFALPSLALLLAGCQTADPIWYDVALGKHDNCWGYRVAVEVSDPGCRIEVNDDLVATLPGTSGEIVVWGYRDGKLRERQTVRIVAHPVRQGQFVQTKVFTSKGEDRAVIPRKIYFNLGLEPSGPTERKDIRIHKDETFKDITDKPKN